MKNSHVRKYSTTKSSTTTMKTLFLALTSIIAGIASVNAHAYLASVTTSASTYPGWAPFSDP